MNTFAKDELKEMSMIELAFEFLKGAEQPLSFQELFEKIADAKELTDEQRAERIANVYTELNVDGRFINLGNNEWGLRKWYTLDKVEAEITTKTLKKRAKKDKEAEDFDDELEEQEYDEEELDDEELLELDAELDEEEDEFDEDDDEEKLDGFIEDDEFIDEEDLDEDF